MYIVYKVLFQEYYFIISYIIKFYVSCSDDLISTITAFCTSLMILIAHEY